MHLLTEIIGWIGAVLSMIFLVPQVWKTFRTKSALDISMWGNIATSLSGIVWIIYAIFYEPINWQIIATNSLMSLCAIILLIYQQIWVRHNREAYEEAKIKSKASRMSEKKLRATISKLEKGVKR